MAKNTVQSIEPNIADLVNGWLKSYKVNYKLEQESLNTEIDQALNDYFSKNGGKGGYELRLYNTSGKQTLSKDFTGDYGNVKLSGGQVIMYDGKNCSIFMKNGIQKFKGRMDNNILEMFPVGGVNQYIVLSANGMEKVRLVK